MRINGALFGFLLGMILFPGCAQTKYLVNVDSIGGTAVDKKSYKQMIYNLKSMQPM